MIISFHILFYIYLLFAYILSLQKNDLKDFFTTSKISRAYKQYAGCQEQYFFRAFLFLLFSSLRTLDFIIIIFFKECLFLKRGFLVIHLLTPSAMRDSSHYLNMYNMWETATFSPLPLSLPPLPRSFLA